MTHKYHVLLCYKNFATDCNVSHIGLGVTAAYTAKTLLHHGIFAQALPIVNATELATYIRSQLAGKSVTHVLIMAQFLPTLEIAKLVRAFPEITFGLKCHSNVGFLQAEPPAIKLLREAIDLETGTSNFYVCGNNHRLVDALKAMYGRPIQYLPNLYWLHGREPIHRPLWQGGTLRIGAFGSLRVYKNFSTAIAASVMLRNQLNCPVEVWINSGRTDGGGNVVYETAKAWTKDLPGIALRELPWASWPEFKRAIGTMNILLQPSYTETFNNVTADGIAEGVPSVVSDTIEWTPKSWKASTDEAAAVAGVARRLLGDPHAAHEGYQALVQYVERGLHQWRRFFQLPPNGYPQESL